MRMKNASTKIGKSLEWDNAMPAYAFERFGKGGEAIFQGFKNGQAALAFNTEEILRFTKDCFTEKEAQEWGKDIKTLELENGETLNIPVSYIMSLHCLMKRAQAQRHIFGGGIRVSNYKAGSKLMQDTGHNVTEQDVKNLESMLTERQIWVADQMQNYMAEKGSEWGNYVSLRRFGYRFFEEGPTYFPISSDGDFLPTFNEEGGKGSGEGRNLYALLNISPAKDIVKGANNRIAIYDIFDVFANHMSDMAQYNAFALPVLDAIKWFNYKEKFNNPGDKSFKPTSIKQSMREAFGDAAVGYVKNLIADVSGAQATGGNENSSGLTMLHRYNRAQVAANLRVALLQPLSYVRAGMELNIGSMAKALALNPIRLRSNIAEMQELSGIARWKELGFYDNNVSRSVRQLIKGEERTIDKITTKTMTLAEKMDQVTWAAMWEASKQQVARRIGRNSENFYDEVVKLFENTIYKTQVVDSILTKSSFMRNGSTWNKVMSSFMSESVTTYNMIADCIWKLADMSRSDNVTAESKQRLAKKIGRAGIVYAANVIVTTILEALMNAYRDDDDYKTFWEKFKDGIYVDLIDNAAPWNWLPLWSQLWDVVKGGINVITGDDNWYSYGTDNPFTQGAQMLVDYTSKIKQKIEAIEKDGADAWMSGYTKWGLAYKGMQAVSAISGLPFATGAREAVSIWNATAANADHQLKLQTYNTPVSVGTNALIQAAAGNDSARALQLVQEMQENGYDLESIQKKTVSAAAVAVYNNELDIDTAVRILKEYGGKTKTEAESYLHDYLTKKETDYNSKYGHVYEYISDWNGSELKREIKLLQDQGNENKNIMSGITNQFKKEYIAASKSERATMKQHLIVAYKLLGLSEEAAAKKIDDWLK
jgi:tetrahydromethanopterin S-methyltransferase subunit G